MRVATRFQWPSLSGPNSNLATSHSSLCETSTNLRTSLVAHCLSLRFAYQQPPTTNHQSTNRPSWPTRQPARALTRLAIPHSQPGSDSLHVTNPLELVRLSRAREVIWEPPALGHGSAGIGGMEGMGGRPRKAGTGGMDHRI